MNHWYIHTLIWHVPSHHQVVAHKGTNTHTHTHTHLLKPLLLQTDDIEVKVCPQAVGPVESDSPRQAIPVGLMREREADTQRISVKTSDHRHQVCHSTFKYLFDCSGWGKAVKEREQTHSFNFSLFRTLFLSVQSSLASRCLHTLRDCICNSGKAITQSLQIFRGVIGYNVAWKWLRAGKVFFFFFFFLFLRYNKSSQCCSDWKSGTSGPVFSQMSGSHRSGSYSLSTDNCAGKHLSYYFDSESECLSTDSSAVHRNKEMLLQWRIIMNDNHRGWWEAYLSTVEAS